MNIRSYTSGFKRLVFLGAMFWVVPASAHLLISEIFYDAAGSDNGFAFVELAGPPGLELGGISLVGRNGADGDVYKTVPLSGVVPADEIFVIGDDDGSGNTFVSNADLILEVDFQNGPDSVLLWDGDTALDAVGYGDFSAAVFAGEGSPASDAHAGASLARRVWNLDTNDNGFDFMVQNVPTPGSVLMAGAPLPGTLWLFGSGILLGATRSLAAG